MIPSKESLQKLSAWIESLPEEAKGKCSMCNETLTHLVKQAEAQTGAPMTTVCRALADKVNKDAAPQDKVTPRALRDRVLQKTGEKRLICAIGANENEPEPEKEEQPKMQTAQANITPKPAPKKIRKNEVAEYMQQEAIASNGFEEAYLSMIYAIKEARESGWTSTTKIAALSRVNSLTDLINQ